MFQAEGMEGVRVLRQDHDCLVEEAREPVWLEPAGAGVGDGEHGRRQNQKGTEGQS